MLNLLVTAVAVLVKIGSFAYAEEPDPMNDRLQAVAILSDGPSQLKIGCMGTGGTKVAISFETEGLLKGPGLLYEPNFSFRFDAEKAKWDNSWNFEPHQAYIRNSGPVGSFASKMVSAGKLAMRFDREGGGTIDAVFSLDGVQDAFARIAKACGDTKFSAAINGVHSEPPRR